MRVARRAGAHHAKLLEARGERHGLAGLRVLEAVAARFARHVVARVPQPRRLAVGACLAHLEVRVDCASAERHSHRLVLQNAVLAVVRREYPAHAGVLLQDVVAPIQRAARIRPRDRHAVAAHVYLEAVLAQAFGRAVDTHGHGIVSVERAAAGRDAKILRKLPSAELERRVSVIRDDHAALRNAVLDERHIRRERREHAAKRGSQHHCLAAESRSP